MWGKDLKILMFTLANVKAELVQRFGETMCRSLSQKSQESLAGSQDVPVEMEDSNCELVSQSVNHFCLTYINYIYISYN